MLGIGLMLFCLRGLKPDAHWREGLLKGGFWTLNIGLSLMALLFPVALIIATDTGAYFAGRSIGGAKLAPRISPNKTWAGLIGGMIAASAVSLMLYPLMPLPNTALSAILVGCFTALLGQAGDLFESWLKRRKGLKDSGSLLPGHGGILDRLDSYATVLPFFLLYLVISAEVMA